VDDDPSDTCICQRWPMLVMACSFFIFGAIGLIVTYVLLQDKALEVQYHYGIVIDAGSSHTDINLYRWPSDEKYRGTARIHQIGFDTCSDVGIASFKDNPSNASKVVEGCIDKYALSKIPTSSRPRTPVFVGATAGMRLLCARDVKACNKILESIRSSLKKYKFDEKPGNVYVLPGNQEGTFGWVTVNLLTKRIPQEKREKSLPTLGALDMGGASAEITFVPEKGTVVPSSYSSYVRLYGRDYNLYTHSFLCYGMKEAERRLLASLVQNSGYSTNVTNPCLPRGFTKNETARELWLQPCSMKPKSNIFPVNDDKIYSFFGSSDYDKCQKIVSNLFNETSCNFGTCSFDGVYQPNITGQFVAYSGYAFAAEFFNVTETDKVNKLSRASRKFCNETWPNIRKKHSTVPVKYLSKNCFSGVYIYEILTYGFHFKKNSDRVTFKRKVNGKEVGWSLGLMVNTTNLIPTEELKSKVSRRGYIFFTSLSAAVMAFGIMLCFCYSIKRCRARNRDRYTPISVN